LDSPSLKKQLFLSFFVFYKSNFIPLVFSLLSPKEKEKKKQRSGKRGGIG
jgi:hypothetical protein